MTVEELRKSGYKVRVIHTRRLKTMQKLDGVVQVPSERGGKTIVEITTPDGMDLVGIARCSRKENFNRRLGVRIALGRALRGREVAT